MEFRCEDLPRHGLVLVPPASPDYDPLLADIQRRLDRPVAGGPPAMPPGFQPRIDPEDRDTSAILVHRGDRSLYALTLIWRYTEPGGRSYSSTYGIGAGAFPSLLLPFGLDAARRAHESYWNVVLPGSKRYLGGGKMIGDNSDVRAPAGDEIWKGGVMGFGGGGGGRRREGDFRSVVLSLDGVFFTDGLYAGPNTSLLWERVTGEAEATMQVARIARQGHFDGLAPERIFAAIEERTGPASDYPPPAPVRGRTAESWRSEAFRGLANRIASMRRMAGDERTLYILSDWAAAELPAYRQG